MVFKKLILLIDAHDVHDFPKLSEEIIQKKITLGSYQLNNCRSYLAEHFNSNGKLQILINRNSINDCDKSIVVASISPHWKNEIWSSYSI